MQKRQESDCKVGRTITRVRSVVNNEGGGVYLETKIGS